MLNTYFSILCTILHTGLNHISLAESQCPDIYQQHILTFSQGVLPTEKFEVLSSCFIIIYSEDGGNLMPQQSILPNIMACQDERVANPAKAVVHLRYHISRTDQIYFHPNHIPWLLTYPVGTQGFITQVGLIKVWICSFEVDPTRQLQSK